MSLAAVLLASRDAAEFIKTVVQRLEFERGMSLWDGTKPKSRRAVSSQMHHG